MTIRIATPEELAAILAKARADLARDMLSFCQDAAAVGVGMTAEQLAINFLLNRVAEAEYWIDVLREQVGSVVTVPKKEDLL